MGNQPQKSLSVKPITCVQTIGDPHTPFDTGGRLSPATAVRGFLSSTVMCPQCRTCTTVRVVSTACVTVSLPSPAQSHALPARQQRHGIVTVQDCLDGFFDPETIEGFRCDTCKATVETCFKVTTLTQAPALLVVHINRLEWPSIKNNATVFANAIVDINGYVRVAGDQADRDQECARKYRLVALIEHLGGATSGHYVCYRRHPGAIDNASGDVDGMVLLLQVLRQQHPPREKASGRVHVGWCACVSERRC